MIFGKKLENATARPGNNRYMHHKAHNSRKYRTVFDKLTLIIVNRHTIEYNKRRKNEEVPGVFDTPDVLNLHLL